jgi:hypothetical protein
MYYNEKKFMHPNTRLEFLTVEIEIPESTPVYFLKINKVQNEYDEIDLGKLERESESNFKTDLNINAGTSQSNETNAANNNLTKKNRAFDKGDITEGSYNYSENGGSRSQNRKSQTDFNAAADLSYQNREQIREAIDVKLKRLRVGYTNSAKKITIAQRGRIGGDISDNIYINAIIKSESPTQAKVYTFQNLIEDSASEWQNSARLVKYISNKKGILNTFPLTIKYTGLLRTASNNWLERRGSNALEYDDKVIFYKIEMPSKPILNIDISSLYNYEVNFELQFENQQDTSTFSLFIKPALSKEEKLTMFFADYYNVKEFENIVKKYLEDIKKNPTGFDYNRIVNKNFSLYFINNNNQSDTIHLIDSDSRKVKSDSQRIKNFQMFSRHATY